MRSALKITVCVVAVSAALLCVAWRPRLPRTMSATSGARRQLNPTVDGVLTPVMSGYRQASLTWTAATDGDGIASYQLRFLTGGTPPTCASGTLLQSAASPLSFLHEDLADATQYSYRVCATDGLGNQSTGATASDTTLIANYSSVVLDNVNEYLTAADDEWWSCDDEDAFFFNGLVLVTSGIDNINPFISKSTGAGQQEYAVFTLNATGSSRDVQFSIGDGTGNFITCDTADVLTADRWHWVTAVFDAAGATSPLRQRVWIDNVEHTTACSGTAPTTMFNSTAPINLGRNDQFSTHHGGQMDFVSFGCDTISTAERNCLQALVDPATCGVSQLRGYFRIGDGDTHPTATNSAAGGINMTYTNTEAGDLATEPVAASSNRGALHFETVDQWLRIDDNDLLECDDEDAMTVCVLYYSNLNNADNNRILYEKNQTIYWAGTRNNQHALITFNGTANLSNLYFVISSVPDEGVTNFVVAADGYIAGERNLYCARFNGAGATDEDRAQIYRSDEAAGMLRLTTTVNGAIPSVLLNGPGPFMSGWNIDDPAVEPYNRPEPGDAVEYIMLACEAVTTGDPAEGAYATVGTEMDLIWSDGDMPNPATLGISQLRIRTTVCANEPVADEIVNRAQATIPLRRYNGTNPSSNGTPLPACGLAP